MFLKRLISCQSYSIMHPLFSISVVFTEIQSVCVFAKYKTLKVLTKLQFIYVNELILTPFSLYHVKCKKSLKMWFQSDFFIFSQDCSQSRRGRGWEGHASPIPIRIFIDYATVLFQFKSSRPMHHLGGKLCSKKYIFQCDKAP